MNVRILRHRDRACSILELDQSIKTQICHLGREAQGILAAQDQGLWARASNPDFLAQMVAGAIILQRIGAPNDQAVVLEDDGSHLAFMTCTAMALVAANLSRDSLGTLQEVIPLLALCCPIEVTVESLPPLRSLPERYRKSNVVRQQYQDFAASADGPRDVMLADALALLRIFQAAKRPGDSAVVAELLGITEGLRTALQRVQVACRSKEMP